MGLKTANRSVSTLSQPVFLDANRFWREALARMRFVRKDFWEGYQWVPISIQVYIFEAAERHTIVLRCWLRRRGRCLRRGKNKVYASVLCIVLTNHAILGSTLT